MRKESLTTEDKSSNKLWWLLAAGGLIGLSFAGASDYAKRLVRERAGGKCEACGESVTGNGIVGHLDHSKVMATNGHHHNRYNSPTNLRLHCLPCEAEWHIQHIGKAKDIGLDEFENNGSVMSNLMNLYYYRSKRKFWDLYDRYQDQIDWLFNKFQRELPKR